MAKRAALTAIDLMPLAPGRGATLHRRIYFAVLDAIAFGKLTAGARLPSTRMLSRALGVSRNSVMHAFEQLHAEGYLETKIGSGTCVAGRLPSTPRKPLTAANPMRYSVATHAKLIAPSGYPIEQKDIEDCDGNHLYLYES